MATATLTEPMPFSRMHRFTVEEYHRMIAAGVFAPSARVELLDGVVVKRMPPPPMRSSTIRKLVRQLTRVLPPEFMVSPRMPITLSKKSELEPDVAIVHGPGDRYADRHPGPDDVALLIEVSDESSCRDRHDRGSMYAAAKIHHYWIVNLVDKVVDEYFSPGPRQRRYAIHVKFETGPVSLILFGRKIADLPLRDIFP